MKNPFPSLVVLLLYSPFLGFSATSAQAAHTHLNHCVEQLAPLQAGETTSKILAFHCYATFSQAIAAATGGRVQLPAHATPADLGPADLAPHGQASPNTTYVLSIEYWDWHYLGTSWTLTGSLPCNQVGGYGLSYVGNTWNDQISSARGFSNCNHVLHWENANFGGTVLDCHPDCYEMGAMNDQTSSIQWHS